MNISTAPVAYDPADPEGFRGARARFGADFGPRQTGASLYELPPGQAVCPYHYEYGEEEWLLVIEGRPTVRTPDDTSAAEPMDLVFFATGPSGAHEIRNDTDETVRVLIWSNVVYPTATAYPTATRWACTRAIATKT